MTTRTIEAQLILSAQDKTAVALAKVKENIASVQKSVEQFRAAAAKFGTARSNFRAAQTAVEQAAMAMRSAATPTKALQRAYEQAQRAVVSTSAAFEAQKAVLLGAKRELESTGVSVSRLASEEERLKVAVSESTAAMERQQVRAQRLQRLGVAGRGVAGSVGGQIAGLAAAYGAGHFASASLHTYREFDKERRFQAAVMGISDAEQAPLVRQAIRGGATTKYNDIQWLEAQRELASRGLNKDQILGMMPAIANLGQALDLSLPEAALQMEGAIFGLKKDTSSEAAARASARRTSDLQVKAAKISGMKPDDIRELYKYGATPARLAGMSEEQLLAFGAVLKKANMGGDESGVAFRALIANMEAPTRKAKEALLANGMNFKNYQHAPNQIALQPFVANVAAQYGVRLSAAAQAGLGRIFSNKALLADPAKFAPAVTQYLRGELHGRDAKSLRSIAGAANRYRDASIGLIDTKAFLKDLFSHLKGNLQLANAIFGPKQGGRIATVLSDPQFFARLLDQLENHADDYAADISEKRMAGFDGALSRFEGALKNVETALGRAWDNEGKGGPLTAVTSAAASLMQKFAELDYSTQRVISAFVGLGAVGAGLKAFELGISGTATALLAIPRMIAGLVASAITSIPGRLLGPLGPLLESTVPANAGEKPFGPDWLHGPGPSNWTPRRRDGRQIIRELSSVPSAAEDMQAAFGGKAEVKGSADLNVNVQVEPSDSFISRIVSGLHNEINVFTGGGSTPGRGVGTDGSTGLSMPEAVPPR